MQHEKNTPCKMLKHRLETWLEDRGAKMPVGVSQTERENKARSAATAPSVSTSVSCGRVEPNNGSRAKTMPRPTPSR